ncbi:xylulokinase [Nitrincola nitratireducens]|uniref:Xylulose kinase n=1 Tax=Nitrincola nitratireducens TaxID=1229521 RepID=W9V0G5_9GAMM|nr:xylulokinase [Nitrincola nitratireducens]EXJ12978.1 Xylulose kinase [Nitrincola nitratireducens]
MYLGIDCGTQSTKVVILDAEKEEVIAQGHAPHSLISDAKGKREQNPEDWILALEQAYWQAVNKAAINPSSIRAIGVSGQQHGLVVLDAQGQVIRPAKLWCDTETAPQNAELLQALGGDDGSMQRLGLVVTTGYTLSKLAWMQQYHPSDFKRIAHLLLPHDFLNYWLTGQCMTEAGDASGTGYFDVRRRGWCPDVFELIPDASHLRNALPDVIDNQQMLGKVRPEVAKRLGLSADVWVSSGGGDNMMAAIGTGNVQEGRMTLSLGTSATLSAHLNTHYDGLHPSIAHFCSSTNGWLPLICTMNLTGVVEQMRQLLNLSITEFTDMAASAPIGASGLTLLPFLNGERVPNLPQAQGQLLGMTPLNLTSAHMSRAVFEGISYGLKYGLDCLLAAGLRPQSICVTGGGAKNTFWRQLLADLLRVEIVCPAAAEGAALGAAIQALWADHHRQGDPVNLTELTARLVALDESTRVVPCSEKGEAYHEAYQTYQHRLRFQFPELTL